MKHTYSPLESSDDCSPCTESKKEERYPTAHLDVSPSQLKGLEVDQDIEIVLKGKLKSFRFDSDDSWGTGASVCISLRNSEIKNTEMEGVIDELIGDD